MDPILASQTFATIIGLICNYKQDHAANQTFPQYLEQHRFDDIKNAIAGTQALQDEVNRLLREDNVTIIAKLNLINDVLTQVLSKVSGFEVMAQQLGSGAMLSQQALHILVVFHRTNANQIVLGDPPQLHLYPQGCGLGMLEPRFLTDDLNILEGLGFIRKSYDDGAVCYNLTRSGAAFAESIPLTPEQQAEFEPATPDEII
ncbi:MAG TPA: hypothetical protein VG347_01195 [Verrucomicrobiae bacterium]|nr:hypothetical protein [Verrucomicrobiae bacterium]